MSGIIVCTIPLFKVQPSLWLDMSSKAVNSCPEFHTTAKECHSSGLYLGCTEFPEHETILSLKFKNSMAGLRVGFF